MRIGLTTLDAKQHILDEAGFAYNFDRRVYFNRKSKKIISVQYAQDAREDVLRHKIDEDNGCEGWKYYFNSGQPPEPVRREIEASLGRG